MKLIIASATNPVGLVIGLITGYTVWKSTKPEKSLPEMAVIGANPSLAKAIP